MSSLLPSRFENEASARQLFGDAWVERLSHALLRTDPLADAAASELAKMPKQEAHRLFADCSKHGASRAHQHRALKTFFESLETPPSWKNEKVLREGGSVVFRTAPFSGLALGFRSLVGGYASPAGNKPLMFSGRLQYDVAHRLASTSAFVRAVSQPHGLERFNAGYRAVAHVRWMHAEVRRRIWNWAEEKHHAATSVQYDGWNSKEWGEPINQHDMCATALLFSTEMMSGLSDLGIQLRPGEAEQYQELWRYAGYHMGVEEMLLPKNLNEARKVIALILHTQAPPDDDARTLVKAFLESGGAKPGASKNLSAKEQRRTRIIATTLLYLLQGEEKAKALGADSLAFQSFLPTITKTIAVYDGARRKLPGSDRLFRILGERMWAEASRI